MDRQELIKTIRESYKFLKSDEPRFQNVLKKNFRSSLGNLYNSNDNKKRLVFVQAIRDLRAAEILAASERWQESVHLTGTLFDGLHSLARISHHERRPMPAALTCLLPTSGRYGKTVQDLVEDYADLLAGRGKGGPAHTQIGLASVSRRG